MGINLQAKTMAWVNLITPEPEDEDKFEPGDASSPTSSTGIS